jgi:hypothetical protein
MKIETDVWNTAVVDPGNPHYLLPMYPENFLFRFPEDLG